MKKLAVAAVLAGLVGCIKDAPVGAYMGGSLTRPVYQAQVNYKMSELEARGNASLSTVVNKPAAAVADDLARRLGTQMVPVYQTSGGTVLAEVGPVDDLSRFMVVQSLLAMTDEPCTLVVGSEYVELQPLKPMPKAPVYAPPRYAPGYPQPGYPAQPGYQQPGYPAQPGYQPQPAPVQQPQPGTETWEGMPVYGR